ncbi:MAG: hypothetical protein Q4E32_09900 [Bacteroidales bacterium]|nr:hypothetical protein [Bacteroidales bacterium]
MTQNKKNIPAPPPVAPIDPKTVQRIRRLNAQQICGLAPRHMRALTHDFDGRYARMIMCKGEDTNVQITLLNAMLRAFRELYYNSYTDTYSHPIPWWMDEWGEALAFGELVQNELPEPTAILPAVSIPDLVGEEGLLKKWMEESMKQLSTFQQAAVAEAQDIVKQTRSMRDGSITRLQTRLTELDAELKESQEKCNRLQAWYDSWQEVRNEVAQTYDPADIAEAGGMDDPTAMAETLGAIMSHYNLVKENEKLREQQEAWRESDEYKQERNKWERKAKQGIDVQDLKSRLLAYAETFGYSNSEQLRSFVLNLNEILRGTPWETVARDIVSEALAKIKSTPAVQGDYVVNKHVDHEVNGVNTGGTGISVN